MTLETILSDDAIRISLRRQGVPPALIEKHIAYVHRADTPPQPATTLTFTASASAIVWPVRLIVPWSYLVSDNDKHVAKLITVKGAPKAIMVITREYALAQEKIVLLAKTKVDQAAPYDGPCAILARVWMPDERAHDQSNFCKIVHDALEGVILKNDRWLHDVHWIRAGVDVDAPRAEITITPISR